MKENRESTLHTPQEERDVLRTKLAEAYDMLDERLEQQREVLTEVAQGYPLLESLVAALPIGDWRHCDCEKCAERRKLVGI